MRYSTAGRAALCRAIVWAGLCCAGAAQAQDYPTKQIRMIVSTAPGGASDFIIRPVAQKLSETFRQPVVIDNRAGASGIIAMEITAKSPPDGYTLLFGTIGNFATNSAIYDKLPFDVQRDFQPISRLVETPFVLSVHPSLPVKSVKDLVALARQRPGQITYATWGVGSFSHFLAEAFGLQAGIRLVHVAYKGSAPALTDLVAGHVSTMFDTAVSAMPMVREKRIRPLAIGAPQRLAVTPDVPTFAEAGFPDYGASAWFGVFTPARTPRPVVDRLHAELQRTLAMPDIRERLESVGARPAGNTPEEFAALIRSDIERFRVVAQKAQIRAE